MAKPRKSFLLRVDPRVHDALKRWADAEFRSMNGQVEYLLRQILVEKGRLKDDEIDPEPPRPGRPSKE
jgi:hypothetical protein